MAVISRHYATESDYQLMRDFLRQLPDMRISGGSCTVGDLDWWRFGGTEDIDYMRNIRLWLDDQRNAVVGFAWVFKDGSIDLFVDPRYRYVETEMIDWSIGQSRSDGDATLTIVANDRDRLRRESLAERGFEATDAFFTYRGHSLELGFAVPVLPNGYRFGDLIDASDAVIAARVEVHRAAWHPSKLSEFKHRRVMQSPTYRPDLDLVIIGPDEEFASCTIVWHDELNEIGVFEPVGCHPDHRQRGLTKALMYEGMRRLQKLGAKRAFVNSWHESVPANRLYESCGFRLIDRMRKWTLTF